MSDSMECSFIFIVLASVYYTVTFYCVYVCVCNMQVSLDVERYTYSRYIN